MKSILPLVLGVLLLSGCATLSPEQITTEPTNVLCYYYSDNPTQALKAELVKRNVFNEAEWKAIDQHDAYIGMSEDAMFCALGIPYDSHSTQVAGANGTPETNIQWIWNHVQFGGPDTYTYVYTTNGVVTAIQN